MSIQTIRASDLYAKCSSGECVELIDVRTPAEYQALHASVARNAPLDSLKPIDLLAQRNGNSGNPLYIICRSGSRAEMACKKFFDIGFTNVISVEGGTTAWEAQGLPVNRGKRSVISLDRQMRITAGSLALLGCALGYCVHPYGYGLAAFVGCGLVFAGVTDICPMLMMISRMPWNQGEVCDSRK